ncbi:MAG: metallophosphoesterase [Patescibacteria group bacterium]
MEKFNKLLESFQQKNKLVLTVSAFGLILFILLSATLPFKDKIFSVLYKIIPGFAVQSNISPGNLKLSATFNSIGIELPFYGDNNGNATASLEFKKSSESDTQWRKGLDLWRTQGTEGLTTEGPNQEGQVSGVVSEANAQTSDITFGVIGDFGRDDQGKNVNEGKVASLVKSWNPDFIITTGDNNYGDGAAATIDPNIGKYYHEYIGNYQGTFGAGATENKFFPSLGNHDWHQAPPQPYLDYFTLPQGAGNERYYDFVKGPVHFFAVDSDSHEPDGTKATSTQAQWLQQKLQAATEPWKVVYFHHPPYASGQHPSLTSMRWPFKEWGASVVLSGHNHHYERLEANGLPYLIVGSSGSSIYDFRTPISESIVRYNSKSSCTVCKSISGDTSSGYGAMKVTANNTAMTLSFINTNGTEVDTLTLPQAGVSPTPTPTPTATSSATPTPTPTPSPSGNPLSGTATGSVSLAATYESISVYAPFSNDPNGNNSATFKWRKSGEAWKNGMDMTVDRRDRVISSEFNQPNPVKNNAIASVLNVSPNTQYEVQVTFADPDGVTGTNPLVQTITTRNDSYPSTGAAFYVASTGSDTNPGTESQPFKTIQKAVDSANVGNTVLVKAGTYQEKVTVSKSGTQDNYITIKNFGSDKPLIDASNNPLSCGGGHGANANCAFLISGSFIHLSGFEITKARIGIKIDSPAQHVVIENNHIHDTLFVSSPSMPIKVGFNSDNQVKNITISGNTVVAAPGDPAGHAMEFHGTKGGNVIRNNTITFIHRGVPGVHGSDCIGGAPNDAIWGLGPDTDIYNNTCIGATDDGLEVEGGAMNSRVWGNKVMGANNSIAIAAVIVGPAYIFRNTLYDSTPHWIGGCGGVKTGEDGQGSVYFYHNTFYLADPANACNGKSTIIQSAGGGADSLNVFYRNNIFHGFDTSINIGEATTQNLDYNIHHDQDQTGRILQYNNSNYSNFTTFQTATGQEAHGIYGRPIYQNEAGKDFKLASGSLGIDQGVVLAGFNDADSAWPYSGSAPDIGACEGTTCSATTTPGLSPTPTPTPEPLTLAGAFYGSALLLDQNTSYDIRVTINDVDGVSGNTVVTGTITTRADNIPAASSLTPTHFVRADGSDSNNGTTEATAWKTLEKAIRAGPSGAIVEVGPGFYKNPTSIRTTPITLKAKFPAVGDNREIINQDQHSVIEPPTVAAKGAGIWQLVTLTGPGNKGAPPDTTYKVWKWINSGLRKEGPFLQLGIAPTHEDIPQRVANWKTDTNLLDTPAEWAELLYTNKTYNYGFWVPPGSSDIYIRIYDPSNTNHRDPVNSGLDPNNFWVTVGGSKGLPIGASNSRVSGFEVRQFNVGAGVGSSSVIDHNLLTGNTFGILLYSVKDVVIERNLIVDSNLWTDDPTGKPIIPWGFVKREGVIAADDSRYGNGSKICASCEVSAFYDRTVNNGNIVIRHNTIDGTFDGIVANGRNSRGGRDYDIHDNLIQHLADDAFEPDGNSINWRVWNNRIENAMVGVSPGPLNYGPFYLFRNQFYKIGTLTGAAEGGPTGNLFKYSGSSNPTARVFVLHNSVWTDIPGVLGGGQWATGGPNTEHFYLRNNLFRVTSYAFDINQKASAWDEDYNHFATTDTERGLRYGGKRYKTDVAGYRTASGQGTHTNLLGDFVTHSIIDNALNAPANGDLTLKAGSPFIDTGVVIPNISDICGTNFNGAAPDLGASEGTSALPCGATPPLPSVAPAPSPSATPTTAPGVLKLTSHPTAEVSADAAIITWETNLTSSSRIDFGLTNKYIGNTVVATFVTNHKITLSDLAICTKYRYKVSSQRGTDSVDKSGDFTTKGCSGDAGIIEEKSEDIKVSGGVRQIDLGGLKINIPDAFVNLESYFQAKKLDKARVVSAHPQPSGLQAAGDHIYHLDVFSDVRSEIKTFEKIVTVTLTYTDADIAGIDEKTLKIHRFNELTNVWEPLQNCVVNTSLKTVACETTKFSDFALLGASSNPNSLRIFILGVGVGILATLVFKKRRHHID